MQVVTPRRDGAAVTQRQGPVPSPGCDGGEVISRRDIRQSVPRVSPGRNRARSGDRSRPQAQPQGQPCEQPLGRAPRQPAAAPAILCTRPFAFRDQVTNVAHLAVPSANRIPSVDGSCSSPPVWRRHATLAGFPPRIPHSFLDRMWKAHIARPGQTPQGIAGATTGQSGQPVALPSHAALPVSALTRPWRQLDPQADTRLLRDHNNLRLAPPRRWQFGQAPSRSRVR